MSGDANRHWALIFEADLFWALPSVGLCLMIFTGMTMISQRVGEKNDKCIPALICW